MSPQPHDPSSHPESRREAAQALLQGVRSLDPDALKRVRAVWRNIRGIPDSEVPKRMGLQRCQHVIAVERGAPRWEDTKTYCLRGTIGHADIEVLRVVAEQEPPGSNIRRMISDLFDPTKGYQAIGTKKECDEVVAWSLRVHPTHRRQPPRTVSIGNTTTTINLGALRVEVLGTPDDDPIDADFEYLSESDD